MAFNWYACSSIVEGDGALINLDGNALYNGDRAIVITNAPALPSGFNGIFFFEADADSGFSDSIPFVVAPSSNPGDLRWILIGFIPLGSLTLSSGYNSENYRMTASSANYLNDVYDGFMRGRNHFMAAASGETSKACAILSGEGNGIYDAVDGFSVILGGSGNNSYGGDQNLLGIGTGNAIYGGSFCLIGNGNGNNTYADLCLIGVGNNNSAGSAESAVICGSDNYLGSSSAGSAIVCGSDIHMDGADSAVLVGTDHYISGDKSVICGGYSNSAQADKVFIGNGENNYVQGEGAVLLNGSGNNIQGAAGVILNGSGAYLIGEGCVICTGSSNANINPYSFIGPGNNNQITAQNGFVCAGDTNYIDKQYGTVLAGSKGRAHLFGQVVFSPGLASTAGNAQASKIVLTASTTDNTETELFLNSSGTERAVIPDGISWRFSLNVVARQTDGTAGAVSSTAYWTITGAIKKDASSVPVLIGTPVGTGTVSEAFREPDSAAQGTITMSGIAVSDETFVVDTQTFTWKTSRSGAGEVTIGADASEAVTNIVSAITADLSTVTAEDGGGDTVVVTAVTKGLSGNSIAFTESSTNMTVDGSGTLGSTTLGVTLASNWSVQVYADALNESLKVTVIGDTDQTVKWLANIDLLEIG